VGNVNENIKTNMITYESIFNTPAIFQPREDLHDHHAHAIIYTSVTTGRPKEAVLTHKNLFINGLNKSYHGQSKKGTKHLLIPPLFHVAALSLLVHNCLIEGTM
jgi:fatty-acyl-CoA synthase